MNNQAKIRQFVRENPIIVRELGRKLHKKITSYLIKTPNDTIKQMTLNDCIDYMHNQTFNIYMREKSVINDGLAKIFPDIKFEEILPELDYSLDVDYLGFIQKTEEKSQAFGLQIKCVESETPPSERMKASFQNFTDDFGGKVFIVFSLDGEIGNKEVIKEISIEIERLKSLN